MIVGYVYDPVYLKHDTGEHVENRRRLEGIMSYLEKTGTLDKLSPVSARAATPDEIALVHDREYIKYVSQTSKDGGGWLDADTVVSTGTYEAALWAAGGTIEAADAVLEGEASSAFALVRPPGHHATANQAMGFCFFNNVAIAVKHSLAKYGLKRVAIIDFDVHHGNGTQEAFYDNPRVLYISTHESPLYPGTGRVEETGAGVGRGTNINIPLPAGCGDAEFAQVFEKIIAPATRRYQPEAIFVSAGYDAHWADGLALLEVTVSGFAGMVRTIRELAAELCGGRIILGLEGGYNIEALAASVKATFDTLLGADEVEDPIGPPQRRFRTPAIETLIMAVRRAHNLGEVV